MLQFFYNKFSKPFPSFGLAIFRICLGIILLWDVLRIFRIDLIESLYPRGVIFSYTFLELPLVDKTTFTCFLSIMAISCVFITVGFLYRYAMITFTLLLSYLFFLDQTFYNNHIYLIILLGLIMTFLPADSALAMQKKNRRSYIPRWTYLILQFQIIIVYFFGGLAKLNLYWLTGHPTKEIIYNKFSAVDMSAISDIMLVSLITYGGIFFDLFVGLFLLNKTSRRFALPCAILFNISNAIIFDDIYIFPFLMISALILFVDQDNLTRLFKMEKKDLNFYNEALEHKKIKRIFPIIALFVIWQMIMPLRHYFVDGYTDWTGDYQQFSWRMKIQHRKLNDFQLSFIDEEKKLIYPIDYKEHLFPDEVNNMINRPQMMIQFVKYIENRVTSRNVLSEYKITGNINVDFNGKKRIAVFNNNLDLTKIPINDDMNKWVNSIE